MQCQLTCWFFHRIWCTHSCYPENESWSNWGTFKRFAQESHHLTDLVASSHTFLVEVKASSKAVFRDNDCRMLQRLIRLLLLHTSQWRDEMMSNKHYGQQMAAELCEHHFQHLKGLGSAVIFCQIIPASLSCCTRGSPFCLLDDWGIRKAVRGLNVVHT